MPLSVEYLHPYFNEWKQLRQVDPGDKPLVMPQLLPDGGKKVYSFECDQADLYSTVTTYKWPRLLAEDEIGLVQLETLDKISEETVAKGRGYEISMRTARDIPRVHVRLIQS